MSTGPHPQHVTDISPEWLTALLSQGGTLAGNTRVIDVDTKIIGEGVGFLSSVARVRLQYDPDQGGAPESLIVKIEPEAEDLREVGDEMHAFEREIRFYTEVAARVPVRLPRVYATLMEPPDYAIVMEDLSYCTPGDQLVGMHTDQVIAAIRVMARIQARFWNNDAIKSLSWMPRETSFRDHFHDNWPSFVSYASERIGAEAMSIGQSVGAALEWLETEMRRAPPTVVHNDLRADNLLFGTPDTDEVVFIVDWQLATRSMGAFDAARILGGSEPPAERTGHHFEVLRAWHDTLLENGVNDYSWEDAVRHFRIGVLAMLEVPVRFLPFALKQGGRGVDLVDRMTRRLYACALEVDAASVLGERRE